jgi:hypothetical protein
MSPKSAAKAVGRSRLLSSSSNRSGKSGHFEYSWPKKRAKKIKGTYEVAGTTTDGVVILRAKAKPKHFTAKEIRAAISKVQKTHPF